MSAFHLDVGARARRYLELNVSPVRRRIILSPRHLHSASQVVMADELRFKILGGVLYSSEGVRLPRYGLPDTRTRATHDFKAF